MQQEVKNKSIILDFYRRTVGQGDIAFAEEIIADDYIQHSKEVKPGKAGLLEALAYLKKIPKPATPAKPFMRLIADGDFVVTNMAFSWGGAQKVVVDIFRFENGKVAEHWDAMRDVPETTLNGNALMDGPMPNGDARLTIVNKDIIGEFYNQIVFNRKLDQLSTFVAEDLIQHIPEIANGLAGLRDYLQHHSINKVCQVIGEDDFVVVQSEGEDLIFYGVFRLNNGKIIEMWGL